MTITDKTLKRIGLFNCAILIIATIFVMSTITDNPSLLEKIEIAICILTLMFSIFYSIDGYKKDSAKYYKIFLCLFILSVFITIINSDNIIKIVCSILCAICLCMLLLGKDLGKKKSTIISCVILAFNTIKILVDIFATNKASIFINSFPHLVLAIALCGFVAGKYLDKQTRGSK